MKNSLLLILLVGSTLTAFGQFGPQELISTETEKPYLAKLWDLDNDGDIDILTGSMEDWSLSWHENLDGMGSFGPRIELPTDPAYFLSISFEDLDEDGDKDLVFLENNPKRVTWLENIDGNGTFAEVESILENQPNFMVGLKVIDANEDGLLDLIVNFIGTTDDVYWYENLGNGVYSDAQLIIEGYVALYPPIWVDINGDGNVDLLTAHENNSAAKVVWFENTGSLTFDIEHELHQFEFFQSDWTSVAWMQYEDINFDSFKDVVITTTHDDLGSFSYVIQNLDGNGNFGNLTNIIDNRPLVDLDNDGDNDMLGATGGSIFWRENENGQGVFSEVHIVTNEVNIPTDVSTADLNNDGLIDIASSSRNDDKLAWYPGMELSTSDNIVASIKVFPNPTSTEIFVESSTIVKEYALHDSLGRLVQTPITGNRIDVSSLSSGIYYLTAVLNSYDIVKRKIMKQ